MADLPTRIADADLDEIDRALLQALAAVEAPDISLAEIAPRADVDCTEKTMKRRLARLADAGLVRRRQVSGDDLWLYGLAHPESAWAVPGDLDLEHYQATEQALEAAHERVQASMSVMTAFAMVLAAEPLSALLGGLFQATVNGTIIVATMTLVGVIALWSINRQLSDHVENDRYWLLSLARRVRASAPV